MRARLTVIETDERYDAGVREKAKAVLDNRVAEEDFIAAGVDALTEKYKTQISKRKKGLTR